MKKPTVILLTVILCLLFVCLVGCRFIFGDSDNPNKPDGSDNNNNQKYDLKDLSIGVQGGGAYEYTGQPITPTIFLYDKYTNDEVAKVSPSEPHSDLTAEYRNNVEIGQATVTVTAKSGSKKFSGSTQYEFTIKPISSVHVTDFASLKQYLANGIYANVYLDNDVEIPQGERIVIYPNTTLHVDEHNLINRGELINRGKFCIGIMYYSLFDNTKFDLTNYGKLVNDENGDILFGINGNIINHGQFENSGTFSRHDRNFQFDNYIYTDSPLDFKTGSDKIVRLLRSDMSASSLTLQNSSLPYTGDQIVPELDVKETSAKLYTDYTVSCEPNVEAGAYSVTFTACEHSSKLYGQLTLYFEIVRASIQVNTKDALLAALANSNYYAIEYTDNGSVPDDLSVNNAVLTLNNCNLQGNVTLTDGAQILSSSNRFDGDVNLAQDARITIVGKTLVRGRIDGQGAIQVAEDGELYFGAAASQPSVEIVNEGTVYANFAIADVQGDGSVVVRRQLLSSEVTVANDMEYNDGKAVFLRYEIPESTYSVSVQYLHDDGEYISSALSALGEHKAKLVFNDYDKNYYGETAVDYVINRGKITINEKTAEENFYVMWNKMESGNFYSITVNNITISKKLTLSPDITYDFTNLTLDEGVSLTVNGVLQVDGLTIGKNSSFVINEGAEASVTTTYNSGTVVVNGSFINGGNYVNINNEASLSIASDGVFDNSQGSAYLCDEAVDGVDGTVYVRQNAATYARFEDVTEVYYSTSYYDRRPSFSVTVNGQTQDAEYYSASYADNSYITTQDSLAKITVTFKTFSQACYGTAEYYYEILPASITVNSEQELIQALNNVRPETSLCNYSTIIIGCDIKEMTGKYGADFHVRENTTLIVSYKVTANYYAEFSYRNDGVIEIFNNGGVNTQLLTTGTGTSTKHISENGHFYHTMYNYDKIVIDVDFEDDNWHRLSLIGSQTVDLCGHKVNKLEISFSAVDCRIALTSTGEKGVVQSLNVIYAYAGGEKTSGTVDMFNVDYGSITGNSKETVSVDESCNCLSAN